MIAHAHIVVYAKWLDGCASGYANANKYVSPLPILAAANHNNNENSIRIVCTAIVRQFEPHTRVSESVSVPLHCNSLHRFVYLLYQNPKNGIKVRKQIDEQKQMHQTSYYQNRFL